MYSNNIYPKRFFRATARCVKPSSGGRAMPMCYVFADSKRDAEWLVRRREETDGWEVKAVTLEYIDVPGMTFDPTCETCEKMGCGCPGQYIGYFEKRRCRNKSQLRKKEGKA